MKFLKQLEHYIDTAFSNEEEFLKQFWVGKEYDELLELYMADHQTKLVVLTETGRTITDTISTKKFIKWCDKTNR